MGSAAHSASQIGCILGDSGTKYGKLLPLYFYMPEYSISRRLFIALVLFCAGQKLKIEKRFIFEVGKNGNFKFQGSNLDLCGEIG